MVEHTSRKATAKTRAHTLEEFFHVAGGSPQPALVWYDSRAARVELSGRVLENWVAKSANLFVEELDVVPGTLIDLEASVHWRSLAVAFAALRAGGTFTGGRPGASGAEPSELWVGFEHSPAAEAADIPVYLGRAALATSYDGDASAWPEGAVDYCASIRAFADSYEPFEPVSPDHVIDPARGTTVAAWLAEVAHWSEESAARFPDSRGVLLTTDQPRVDAALLACCAGVIASGRAAILVDAELAADREKKQRILHEEQAEPFDPGVHEPGA